MTEESNRMRRSEFSPPASSDQDHSVTNDKEIQQVDIMEDMIADDAVWKRIQQNTFTRWTNEHLKKINMHIQSLETDLEDGLRLIGLLQVLSGKIMPKHNKKPSFRSQKLENVSVALKFLEKDEGIKIVNIDSQAIVDRQLKLILGLIWHLILHYSISMPVWEGDESGTKQGNDKDKGPTPKQRLLNWVQNKVPELSVSNFTSDWKDGRTIGALVDSVAPGLCPDWQDWNPKEALQNASEAMTLADDWLNVRQLIKPEEIVNPNIDELSMMTYLSQYPSAKLNPGAPIREKTNPNRVRCYGPGLESSGCSVGTPVQFTVETFSAGTGDVQVVLENPKGKSEEVEVHFNNDRNLTYTCSYNPKLEGVYTVKVLFGNERHMLHVPRSPFNVNVDKPSGDASKILVFGEGIKPNGIITGKQTYFDISTEHAGKGVPDVVILDPNGDRQSVPVKLRQINENVWRCEYSSNIVGLHSVNVFFNREHVPGSPFPVEVSPVCDPKKVKTSGRGLQPKGVRVDDKTCTFWIHTELAGEGIPEAKLIEPGGGTIPIHLKDLGSGKYEGKYVPTKIGRYVAMISYGGHEILNSPFQIQVGPKRFTGVRAYGPGLRGGMVNHPAKFMVDTNGETGALGFQIEGPGQSSIDCEDFGNMTCQVSYLPVASGDYYVHILAEDEDIEESPFFVKIEPHQPDVHPELVECNGRGLEAQDLVLNQPAEFLVDAHRAGTAPLQVEVMDEKGHSVPVDVDKKGLGAYKCSYKPKNHGRHSVIVSYGGVSTKKSPYRVQAPNPFNISKVSVNGPGVESGLLSTVPTKFVIDTRASGQGDQAVALSIQDDKGKAIPYHVQDNGDDTYSVEYTAPLPGKYQIRVLFDDDEIPQSPMSVIVQPHLDLSNVHVQGLEPNIFLDSPTEFQVEGIEDKQKLACIVLSPSGEKQEALATQDGNGQVVKVAFTPSEEGPHEVELLYDGLNVPGSPFKVNVTRGSDSSRVLAHGKGLQQAIVNEPNVFQIETKGAGTSGLGLTIEGPSEAVMTCMPDNRDGSCRVEYTPTAVGVYDIGITFGEKHIPGSPFKVPVVHSMAFENVRAYGNGLDNTKVREGVEQEFTIDASEAGPAPMSCEIKGLKEPPLVVDNRDGTFSVSYLPPIGSAGTDLTCNLKYNGKDIVNTPVHLKVKPKVEPDQVELSGEGISPKGILASLPASITIDTTNAGNGDLGVEVTGPDGRKRKVEIEDEADGKYKATFLPDDLGDYKVKVSYDGHLVNAPIPVTAHPTGSAELCRITEGREEHVEVGQEYCATVNCKNAGIGAVTCRIASGEGDDVDVEVEENSDETYSVYYKVKEGGDYAVDMKYGGNPIHGGSYNFKADSSVSESEERSSYQTVRTTKTTKTTEEEEYRSLELNRIPVPSTGGLLTAEVKMPTGKMEKPEIEDNRDGTVSIRYAPHTVGVHELLLKYNGQDVQGSPYFFFVDSVSSESLTAYGPGLTHGICGEPCNFTVSTKGSGAGGLQFSIEGNSKAEILCTDNKDGTVSVSYIATAPGEYKISVKFGDKHIRGSPFTSKITGEGRKRNQISVGSFSEVTFPGKVTTDMDLRSLNAFIHAPSGLEEPCFLKRLPNGNIGISFTPREAGEHEVSVRKAGTHIANSPFKIKVDAKEVGDARKVIVTGSGLTGGKTHEENTFNVNTKNAGYGGLSLSIEGPSKCDIKYQDKPDNSLDISYIPTEPGYYIINLTFADARVLSTVVKVTGEGSNRHREKIQYQREAVPVTEVGSECRLTFKMPGVTAFELSASVTSPSGMTEDAAISDVEDGYGVQFIPKELGVHTVSVKHQELHIPGSPFSFTVGKLKDGGAHRVHAGGAGLERGEQGIPCEFNVWTREAGPGSLAISVEGPSKAEIDFKDRKDGSCYVSYTVAEPGEYRVGIRFNEESIPDSPYKVYVSPDTGEAKKVDIGQFPEGQVLTNKPAMFLVRKNTAKGQLDAKLVSPSGAEDDCFIDTADFESYSVRFMPKENGINNLHIKLNQVHIPGSPFRVKVGTEDADPACIHVHGKGIEEVMSGQKTDFFIDTCHSGAGHLAVTIDGPSKVSMDCTELEDGYKVHWTPLATGFYFVSVKFQGCHVPGSPFKVPCTGKELVDKVTKESSTVVVETSHKVAKNQNQSKPALPAFKSNAAKVTSKGMGLKKAYIQKQNQFTINAADAGNNILYVGMLGPKGPCEELFIKHTGRQNYQVNYLCKDRGEYLIWINYGNDPIPGSPFRIEA